MWANQIFKVNYEAFHRLLSTEDSNMVTCTEEEEKTDGVEKSKKKTNQKVMLNYDASSQTH